MTPTAAVMATPEWSRSTRRVMRLFFSYRVVLAIALGIFDLTGLGPSFLGASAPYMHTIVVLTYLMLTFASLGFSFFKLISIEVEYLFAMLVDSIVIAFLVHTSGGPQSGLGILLGISIAFGTQGMPARATILAALLATLAILFESYVSSTTHFRDRSTYSMVAMLGVSYFALALLSYELSNRTRYSEKMLQRQGQDILDLTHINEQVIQHMQTGVVILDQKQQIKMANDAAWNLISDSRSHAERDPATLEKLIHNHLDKWSSGVSNHPVWMENQSGDKDLLLRFQQLGQSTDSGILLFIDDASEATKTAQQLKLAALGRLVASIAHEIRNPLGAIGHANQLLEESEQLQPADKHLTEIIHRNTARVNEVIENILTLSRHRTAHQQLVELAPWLEKLRSDLLENHKLGSPQISIQVTPPDTRLLFDPQQIAQAVNALVENAIVHQPETGLQLHIDLYAGIDVVSRTGFIQVKDNGAPIPQDIVEKIFEPFFTTSHQGTGLGLYIVKALCDANSIRINYQTPKDGGNSFRLRFPANMNHPTEF